LSDPTPSFSVVLRLMKIHRNLLAAATLSLRSALRG
jgi:hypothetical protein